MKLTKVGLRGLLLFASFFFAFSYQVSADDTGLDTLNLVPCPKSVKLETGMLDLNERSRIVLSDPSLLPLANVFAGEIKTLFGKTIGIIQGENSESGDIVLVIDKTISQQERYKIVVADTVRVYGANAQAIGLGTVTVLQAFDFKNGRLSIRKMAIDDEPAFEYRGWLVDVARNWHEIEMLKQAVVMCRWYKFRYLHLHLSDDQRFTFPTKSLPELNSSDNQYTQQQLEELVAFAEERGVIVLPEIEMPGHSGMITDRMPDVFCHEPAARSNICPSKEEVFDRLDLLIGELTQVFKTSPYLHIGADEVDFTTYSKCSHCSKKLAELQLEDPKELYRRFIVRMNEIVKKHGKKTIVWEGFHKEGKVKIPTDITVMIYETLFNTAPDLIEQGYPIINTSWQPLYIIPSRSWSPEHIYGWNVYRWEHFWDASKAYNNPITIEPTPLLLGAQFCSWEMPEALEFKGARQRLSALSERIWNPELNSTYSAFEKRMIEADTRSKTLVPNPPFH